jgi:hypothetical protein
MIKAPTSAQHAVAKIPGLIDWVQSGPFANEARPVSRSFLLHHADAVDQNRFNVRRPCRLGNGRKRSSIWPTNPAAYPLGPRSGRPPRARRSPAGSHSGRTGVRPIEASKAPIRDGCFTSIRDVRLLATNFARRGVRKSVLAQPTRSASDRLLAHRSRSSRPSIGARQPEADIQVRSAVHGATRGFAASAFCTSQPMKPALFSWDSTASWRRRMARRRFGARFFAESLC